ncbi:MAG TPA: DUF3105 domain-containing protein [Gaiellaceae bacterium]|nr:DUF3105 domain-containing protein [Gaiellaceae bacterium]
MAKKKPRTPTPPRVQAPQRRGGGPRRAPGSAPAGSDLGLRHRALLYGVAGAGFVGLVIAVLVIALGGGGGTSDKQIAADFHAAGCTYKTVKAYIPKGQPIHVPSLTKKFPWNTSPPSNGQHYPEWAVWGFYTQAINPRQVVHNEEHGAVVEWWGPKVSPSVVNDLRSFYDEQPDGGFGTPYASLRDKFALTAWTGNPATYSANGPYGFGHLAICSQWTPKTKTAFEAFRKAYRGKGPEGIPLCADEPGDSPAKSDC